MYIIYSIYDVGIERWGEVGRVGGREGGGGGGGGGGGRYQGKGQLTCVLGQQGNGYCIMVWIGLFHLALWLGLGTSVLTEGYLR